MSPGWARDLGLLVVATLPLKIIGKINLIPTN